MGQNTLNEQNAINLSYSRGNENSFVHGNGASNASSFGNDNNRQGNLNLSNWGGGGLQLDTSKQARKYCTKKYGGRILCPSLCREHASYLS